MRLLTRASMKLNQYREASVIFLTGATTILVITFLPSSVTSLDVPNNRPISPTRTSASTSSTIPETSTTIVPTTATTATTRASVPMVATTGVSLQPTNLPPTTVRSVPTTIPTSVPTATAAPRTVASTTTTQPIVPTTRKCQIHNPDNKCKSPIDPPPDEPPGRT